jgi:hypothetical protein
MKTPLSALVYRDYFSERLQEDAGLIAGWKCMKLIDYI